MSSWGLRINTYGSLPLRPQAKSAMARLISSISEASRDQARKNAGLFALAADASGRRWRDGTPTLVGSASRQGTAHPHDARGNRRQEGNIGQGHRTQERPGNLSHD